jgi:hypothetical protein
MVSLYTACVLGLDVASRFGLLVNPNNENAEAITGDLKAAAATIGVEIDVVRATEVEAYFS